MRGLCWVILVCLLLVAGAVTTANADPSDRSSDTRVRVVYWEKWTGFEKDAMQSVVDEFNRSQDRIFVDLLSVSLIHQKTLLATAGGNPPDLAGLMNDVVIEFADKNALLALDDFAKGTNVVAERYVPAFWDMCTHRGHLWAVPTTPVVLALHWNKDLFEKAGLDPDRPPRTITELDAYSRKLTRRNAATGQIEGMGFLPSEPGHWPEAWGYFFDGALWDGATRFTLDSPENVRAYEWVQGYAKEYGVDALLTFRSSFGRFGSPQNAFMSGKVAMELQGVWISNFIDMYNPGMHWGAAPFPSIEEGGDPVAIANSDMLVIPRGAKHPREAFEFVKYLAEQGPIEKLALLHGKTSPLVDVSAAFFARHKNPYIRMFQKLSESKNLVRFPYMAVWNQLTSEYHTAFDRIWLLQTTPKEALADAEKRVQGAWDRDRERQKLAGESGPSGWLRLAPVALVAGILAIVAWFALRERREVRRTTGTRRPARANASLVKGLLFLSPWLGGLLVFVLYPVTSSIVYSFCDYSVLMEPRFVGLLNYQELLGDGVFWVALKNTALYALFALPLGLVFAFLLALLLSSNVKAVGLYRTFIFLPSLTPLVASAMVWLWIFNSQYGVLNQVLSILTFGLVNHVAWLRDARFAMPSLVMMSFWGVGHTVVIMLAAMQEVPTSLYEAADIDGASFWQKVRSITLPMISPVLYFNTILGIIGVLQVFAIPYIMTSGGPARSTYFYSMYLYDNAFSFLRMGYACAMAWILFLVVLALTALAVRAGRTRVHTTA
jgi:ABC-type sugar transport system permease subunit/ABC-type glycerol-3-phosphate transport system substrate-binding protein